MRSGLHGHPAKPIPGGRHEKRASHSTRGDADYDCIRVGEQVSGYGDVAQAYASISHGAFEGAGIAGSTDSCLVTTDLPISISRASGSTFDIYLTVSATAGSGDIFAYGSDGSASLRLTFPDLPAGYSLVSCQGFGAGVTAAKRSSWGALKARYR